MTTAGRVILKLKETGASAAAIDTVGVGAGVYDRLVELGHPVQEMQAGQGAMDRERFANRRAEWFWGLRQRFEDGDIDIDPDDDEMQSQLTTLKYRPNSRGQIVLESKEDMRKRGLPSPDRADALAMAFAAWDMSWEDVYALPEKGEDGAPVLEAAERDPWTSVYADREPARPADEEANAE